VESEDAVPAGESPTTVEEAAAAAAGDATPVEEGERP
jgi:hypothetical protein